jgi:membrane-associated phospholipid phosphatase
MADRRTRSAPVSVPMNAAAQQKGDDDAVDVLLGLERNPVFFWNEVSLDLVALDHSLPVTQARAPGPCGSAKALGIIHSVIADAVAYVYESPYRPQFNKQKPSDTLDKREVFVAGAAFGIMQSIYDQAPHKDLLNHRRRRFLQLYGGDGDAGNIATWETGQTFAAAKVFRELWDAKRIEENLSGRGYTPSPGKHAPDPWNPCQNYYGVKWGQEPALVLAANEVNELGPPTPPSITRDEVDKLQALGGLRPTDVGSHKKRTQRQTYIGLFWAYDGARLLGTPPVLYNLAVRRVAIDDALHHPNNIPLAARLFALCNLAMADAGIVAWKAKWKWAVWRPVKAITTEVDKNWQPLGAPRTNPPRFHPKPFEAFFTLTDVPDTADVLLGASPGTSEGVLKDRADCGPPPDPAYAEAAFTPNFPAYPSGHATFGAACFSVLLNVRKEAEDEKPGDEADHLRRANRINLNDFISEELDGRSRDNFEDKARPRVPIDFSRIVDLDTDKTGDLSTETLIGSNNLSRLYLGVHWTFDQTEGDLSGRRVGQRVHSRAYVRQ